MSATITHIDKKNTLAPKLRFKDKSGKQFPVWEEKKLGAISKIYDGTHQTPTYVSEGIPFYSVEHITANQFTKTKYITQEVFDKENEKVRLEKGDILMTKIGDIGTSKLIDWDVKASFYVSLALIKQSDSFSSKYLNQYIASKNFQLELWKRIIHVAFPKKINLGEIGNCHVKLPTLPEQQKIASFLAAVDEKIQQLTHKKELLEQYKKGVMQQLFSGKLRFKDENGKAFPKWEEKELNDLCDFVRSGGTPLSTKKEFYDGDIPFLSISDMTSQGKYLKNTSNHISKLGLDNSASWIVPANSIIYSMYASVGFVAINKIPIATSQAVLNLILKKDVDTEFTYYTLVDFQKRVSRFITTGTQGNLNAQTVKGFKIKLPCFEEQKKIANYLSAIDNKIESVTKQITQTQSFKKGLLQQMFV